MGLFISYSALGWGGGGQQEEERAVRDMGWEDERAVEWKHNRR